MQTCPDKFRPRSRQNVVQVPKVEIVQFVENVLFLPPLKDLNDIHEVASVVNKRVLPSGMDVADNYNDTERVLSLGHIGY